MWRLYQETGGVFYSSSLVCVLQANTRCFFPSKRSQKCSGSPASWAKQCRKAIGIVLQYKGGSLSYQSGPNCPLRCQWFHNFQGKSIFSMWFPKCSYPLQPLGLKHRGLKSSPSPVLGISVMLGPRGGAGEELSHCKWIETSAAGRMGCAV